MERIVRERIQVLVPAPTLLETYTPVLRRATPPDAHRWLGQVIHRATLVHSAEEDYLDALQRVRRYRDQLMTLFDSVLVVISDRLNVPVWSYDHHIDIMGAHRWLSSE